MGFIMVKEEAKGVATAFSTRSLQRKEIGIETQVHHEPILRRMTLGPPAAPPRHQSFPGFANV